ncbi:MAG TPA: ABC transporter ATP-binding protein [Candidatus Hodarchaeales archaeon]|nr:ABC transporter ATP-binding protein [Candidatus Hodarchaeales archaeon]
MATSDPVIEISGLTKIFGKKIVAVDNLNLTINSGTIHGFLGPNGSGKTTTLRCCLGLLRPNSGFVKIFGALMGPSKVNILRRIGYLPGDVALYPYYTVKQLLNYFQTVYGGAAPLREELIERFDVDESRSTKSLSKGNRQKVGIIQALMHDPDLLILDEPSSGLDPLLQLTLFQVLREFRKRGKTIFFSSHVLSEVDKICNSVSIIRNGRLITTEDVSTLSQKIGRKVSLKFHDSSSSPDLGISGLSFVKRDGELFHYLVKSDFKQAIRALGENPLVADIIVPETSVEDFFMEIYRGN